MAECRSRDDTCRVDTVPGTKRSNASSLVAFSIRSTLPLYCTMTGSHSTTSKLPRQAHHRQCYNKEHSTFAAAASMLVLVPHRDCSMSQRPLAGPHVPLHQYTVHQHVNFSPAIPDFPDSELSQALHIVLGLLDVENWRCIRCAGVLVLLYAFDRAVTSTRQERGRYETHLTASNSSQLNNSSRQRNLQQN